MQHILIKVYGHISPAGEALECALRNEQPQKEDGTEALERNGDMLLISYEGMYYPIEEVVDIVRQALQPATEGKIDYIDMDAWTLTRYTISAGTMTEATRSLNHVMAYSGH
ncbi:hypothetical protein Dde_2759 [Oleidesulfovibrio alaskensis G20]|jgi:hypothetical protein|uniref:Uncharacterized protein n=1 Tax=Oleidesulfovibrio alaskensis (strain ATCC BAA-1058 / DSM 17464 / G20) TaxID=207559 RepID=Q30XP1_OLEA2|nr:hypothetical protein [Oleidesulfovibrio alaskensis]ABB39555.1 hypothetical protein Dde_2759 [Oleidesulfovibrio alaskensis G20]MBG0772385.1 hypothetical protein [Oleidesulfovibrio alaskensis]MBL3582253.1 hypothetical protein [Oleidesulfovibrio alaskensis]